MPTSRAEQVERAQTGPSRASGPDPSASNPADRTGPDGICPFCGVAAADDISCHACGARTDLLSRQATQNEMGPWFVRDETQPFRPGCRLETLERWVRSGRITADSILRGPSTHQNWVPASRAPGIARLLGRCHSCQRSVREDESMCGGCGSALHTERDRQHLGLSAVRPLPGRGSAVDTVNSLLMGHAGSPAHRATATHAVHDDAAASLTRTMASGPAPVHSSAASAARAAPAAHRGSSSEAVLRSRLASARRMSWMCAGVAVAAVLGAAMVIAAGRGFVLGGDPAAGGETPAVLEPSIGDDPETSELSGNPALGDDRPVP